MPINADGSIPTVWGIATISEPGMGTSDARVKVSGRSLIPGAALRALLVIAATAIMAFAAIQVNAAL
jgi:hypothetical protein